MPDDTARLVAGRQVFNHNVLLSVYTRNTLMRTRFRILILLLAAVVASPSTASACGYCSPFQWLFGCGLHHGYYRGDGGYSTWRVIDRWLGYGYLRENQGVYGHYPGNWYKNLHHHPAAGPGFTQNWAPRPAPIYTPAWNSAPAWNMAPAWSGWGMTGSYGGWSECSSCDPCATDCSTPTVDCSASAADCSSSLMQMSSDCSCSGGTTEFLPPAAPPAGSPMSYEPQAMTPGFLQTAMAPQAGPWQLAPGQTFAGPWQPVTPQQTVAGYPAAVAQPSWNTPSYASAAAAANQQAAWNPRIPWTPQPPAPTAAGFAMNSDLTSQQAFGPASPVHGAASSRIHTPSFVPGLNTAPSATQFAAQQPVRPWSPNTAWTQPSPATAWQQNTPQQFAAAGWNTPPITGWNQAVQPAPGQNQWSQTWTPNPQAVTPQPQQNSSSRSVQGGLPVQNISASNSAMLGRYPSALQ